MKTTERLMTQLMMMEGLRLTAYRDAAGVPTIGYGHTKGVRMGDRISEDWARKLLRQDVAEVERQVKAMRVASSEGQLDALVSFAFNVGIGRLRRSTLLRLIREGGTKQQIQREFKRWVYAGGQRLRGLELRREWEARRFFEWDLPTDAEIIDRV
jgi:lysozyme